MMVSYQDAIREAGFSIDSLSNAKSDTFIAVD